VTVTPHRALAQTEGRVSVGASISATAPRSSALTRSVGPRPLIRLNPKRGWAFAGGFNWFHSDLKDPATGTRIGRVSIRPLMGGVGFTTGPATTLVTIAVVAGPSLNSIEFIAEDGPAQRDTLEVSLVVRPGITVTHSLAPRVGLVAFGGYVWHGRGVRVGGVTAAAGHQSWRRCPRVEYRRCLLAVLSPVAFRSSGLVAARCEGAAGPTTRTRSPIPAQ
jgi:hypothetical protein